ncbi:hypothetical protein P5V15_012231 [Pogonomyrmex californicus]
MSLSLDANVYTIAKTVINVNVLRQIENDLDIDEKISVLFLIIDNYADGFNDIFKLFQEQKTKKAYIIIDYIRNHPENWEDKILEALCILNNREVIRKLGISFSDLDLQYIPQMRLSSRNINVITKCLYRLCESLNENEQQWLLNLVKCEICNYDPLLDNVHYLELHMLYWMQIGYITISKSKIQNTSKLLRHLEECEDSSLKIICMDLEKFNNCLHVVDNYRIFGTSDRNYQQSIPFEESSLTGNHCYKKRIQSINNGLCIIINQMYFEKEYETRFGTSKDCINLTETFKTFGFKVDLLQNLKKSDMLEKMKNISKDYGTKYECLFLCILSHGYKGGVITSDEKEISLETIEKTICCVELKDVMKIIVIQACQGKTRGERKIK